MELPKELVEALKAHNAIKKKCIEETDPVYERARKAWNGVRRFDRKDLAAIPADELKTIMLAENAAWSAYDEASIPYTEAREEYYNSLKNVRTLFEQLFLEPKIQL